MKALTKDSITLIWLMLMIATSVSWWLGTKQGNVGAQAHAETVAGIMAIAFIKVRFVIRHFMEVRNAPLVLRVMCDAWTVLVCGVVVLLLSMKI